MDKQLINLTHKILLDTEKVKVLSEFLLEKGLSPEIYVPAQFINKTIKRIDQNVQKIEDIALK